MAAPRCGCQDDAARMREYHQLLMHCTMDWIGMIKSAREATREDG